MSSNRLRTQTTIHPIGSGELPQTLELVWIADEQVCGVQSGGTDHALELRILDQTALPDIERYDALHTPEELITAIKKLEVRGAPALGVAGAAGLALWIANCAEEMFCQEGSAPPEGAGFDGEKRRGEILRQELDNCADAIANARPTAVNLQWGARRAQEEAHRALDAGATLPELVEVLFNLVKGMEVEDIALNKAIGHVGAQVFLELARKKAKKLSEETTKGTNEGSNTLKEERPDAPKGTRQDVLEGTKETTPGSAPEIAPLNVITHCNAGSLATVFYGTALGVIYTAAEEGLIARVFADETRPVGQGERLTAWELSRAGIPVTLQCDNMAAQLMAKGDVDAVIVGADRITANGDVANKIGTYSLAILAKHHGIPFYVAAPESTVDLTLKDGSSIPIEQRHASEVTGAAYVQGASAGVEVSNPAFDVTPAELITAIILPTGAVSPAQLAETVSSQESSVLEANPKSTDDFSTANSGKYAGLNLDPNYLPPYIPDEPVALDESFQARLQRIVGADGLSALRSTHVMILGLGGVGSNCVEALARGGIGKLTVVDYDVVQPSNINRQAIAFLSSVGMRKVDATEALIAEIDPSIEVNKIAGFITKENVAHLIDEYALNQAGTFLGPADYVIDAIDTVSAKLALAVYAQDKPFKLISSMGAANKLHPECLQFADLYKTVNCPLCRIMRKEGRKRGIEHLDVLYSSEVPAKVPSVEGAARTQRSNLGTMSYVPPIMGQMLAGRVIRLILGLDEEDDAEGSVL